ncbi:hypothetical protein CAPTEDRAFT_177942 [Capitella teleta]|uniref:Uncharacterized protein n=1 Tax=Capitella teleta TaxID=283909 RepID=R7TR93_CAPTE|nr:hypothetical protein CAPTEDRAFT_177942 [Capitella teleta]|eukprot:ELT96169.1 hypothetical protein CAPTEDRAFT_177942 [Capitella teleta]
MENTFYDNEDSDIALEIRTLVHPGQHREFEDPIHGVLHALSSLSIGENGEVNEGPKLKEYYNFPDTLVEEESTTSTRGGSEEFDDVIVVSGKDDGFTTEYAVRGLKKHELPVIGTYVDKRVVPGFKYAVRKLGTESYLFKKQTLALQRVGIGYGKRITFESQLKNSNDNYFYSDTFPAGYGFSVVAIADGDAFTVVDDDDDAPVGEGVITQVGLQKEISSHVEEDGSVVKRVAVQFCCDVKYGSNKHGLLPLFHEYTLLLNGVAVMVKRKAGRLAETESIEQLELPLLGSCRLQLTQG